MDSQHRLAAIMFTDIVGYSSLMSRDEEAAMRVVNRNVAIHKELIRHFQGTFLKEMGDGVLAYFESPTRAVRCAGAILAAVDAEDFELRIGIHQSEVIFKGGDIFGDGVNIASRIEALAAPGQTLVSANVFQSIQNKSGISAQIVGPRHIKGFSEPLTLYSVKVESDSIKMPISHNSSGDKSVRQKYQWRLIGIAAIILLIVIALVFLKPFGTNKSPPNAPVTAEDQTIAVLPLINLNAEDENQAYFSNGVTNEIIDELTKVRSFVVTSFSATMLYQDYLAQKKSLGEIADELGVRYLIAGSSRIYSGNDSVRLSIELIDPETQRRIWHMNYNEPMSDVPGIQSGIARRVAESLNIELSESEMRDLSKLSTVSGEAFRLFLEAKSEFAKLNGTGFRRAIELLKQSLELDPNYAQAHTFIAWTYNQSGVTFFQDAINRPTDETIELFNKHANKAIQLDSLSSDIYLVRANLHINHTGFLMEAQKDVNRALEINSWPRIPTNYCICTASTLYLLIGNTERAEELVKISSRIDPANIYIETEKAMIQMTQGHHEVAQRSMKLALQSTPIPFFYLLTGLTYYHNDQFQEALGYFERAYDTDGKAIPQAVAYLANTYYKLGDAEKAKIYQQELKSRMAAGEHHLNYILAMVKMAQNSEDEAIELLKEAQEKHESSLAYFVNLDPIFRPLYQDPDFVEIRSHMQYPQ